ncbi:MAG: glutamine amidotransferase [Candidatus Limnocylindria bacterium]|nr:glutamine amidotransferase [Candidatus Limnocylindria bacterium]
MDLRIAHLYPDLMSIYGDRGNVLALERRARWRGIAAEVRACTVGDALDPAWADLYFFGGGQDQGQDLVGADLAGPNGAALRAAIAGGAAVLAVCGGLQLLGHEYVPETGPRIAGLGVLDLTTRAGKTRFVGNLLAERDGARHDGGDTLVGFENHSGRTYLGPGAAPLARVLVGHGNNGEDGTEGAVQGAVIGTYCHGSVLPKNPWLADLLLTRALARRHGSVTLAPLDDAEERAAHDAAARAARSRR